MQSYAAAAGAGAGGDIDTLLSKEKRNVSDDFYGAIRRALLQASESEREQVLNLARKLISEAGIVGMPETIDILRRVPAGKRERLVNAVKPVILPGDVNGHDISAIVYAFSKLEEGKWEETVTRIKQNFGNKKVNAGKVAGFLAEQGFEI